jgi:hypothetical protein
MKNVLLAVLVGGLLASVGCASPVNISVAFAAEGSYVASTGDSRVGSWDVGEVKSCDVVTDADFAKTGVKRDLLLCGTDARLTWNMLKYKEASEAQDARDEMIAQAKRFAVTFHDGGHSLPKIWSCQRAADGIDCH